MTGRRLASGERTWLVPGLLILLGAIPVVAGSVRLAQLAGGAEITPANARFFAAPAPIVLHVSSIVVWSLLGAFQFSGGFRRRCPGWHRAAGRVLIPVGVVAVLSGLWLSLIYPRVDHDGPLLEAIRWAVSGAWLAFIVLGFAAIRGRDIARHRAWMIRSFAIGLGAGTQAFTHLPYFLFDSMHNELGRALAMGSGWGLNVLVAEWVIRRPPQAETKNVSSAASATSTVTPSVPSVPIVPS